MLHITQIAFPLQHVLQCVPSWVHLIALLCVLNVCVSGLAYAEGLVHASAQTSQTLIDPLAVPYSLLPTFQHIATFEAEVDFVAEIGTPDATQIFASWRDQPRGLILAGLYVDGQRGIPLPNGVYQWTFKLRRGSEPKHLPSSPMFTLAIWDVTTGELLVTRSLHQSDFPAENVWYERTLTHSTVGREQHRFEPRVVWEDFLDGFVDHVRLAQAVSHPLADLEEKALALDRTLQADFLDPIPGTPLHGLVVARSRDGQPAERGDSATMTGLYVAAEALRLRARPGDPEALHNLEKGFQALHTLFHLADEPGVLPRYADSEGQWSYAEAACEGTWHAGRINVDANGAAVCSLQETTCVVQGRRIRPVCPDGQTPYYEEWSKEVISEDAYTAFALAVGVGYPLIADAALKAAIAEDFKAIARHLLTHDLTIVKAGRDGVAPKYVHFNPYLPEEHLRTVIAQQLEQGVALEQLAMLYVAFGHFTFAYNALGTLSDVLSWISFGCLDTFPFLSPDLLPSVNEAMVRAIQRQDVDAIVRVLPEFVLSLRRSLVILHDFLGRATGYLRSAIECVGRLPNSSVGENYRDVLRFIDAQLLPQLQALIDKIPTQLTTLQDLKFDASSAAAAAQVLAVARMLDPGEFEEPYYRFLLGGGKDLLATMETWLGTEETLAVLLQGDLGADKQRSKTNWRSFAALYTLSRLETRPELTERFRHLLERKWLPSVDEGNAFYDALRAAAGPGDPGRIPVDVGVIGWVLANMPDERHGLTPALRQQLLPDIAAVSGGQLAPGAMRDPIPVALRAHHEMFLWQRNPRWLDFPSHMVATRTPSLDFLLAYYMARAAGLTPTPPSTTPVAPLTPAQSLTTSGEIGLTVGRGTGVDRECKTKGGVVRTPSELGRLPGPYGPTTVNRNGVVRLANGFVHARVLTMDGDARLTVNVQPEGVYYWAEVCRAGGIQKPGAEVKFDIAIVAPTTMQPTTLGALCPFELLASSGEQGETLGSGLRSTSRDLNVSVSLPPGAAPLGGPLGTFAFDGNGYDDEFARVRILVWKRVETAHLTKTPTGVSVAVRIHRPSRYRGGAEIKLAVELLGHKTRIFAMGELPTTLTFTAPVGVVPEAQTLHVQVTNATCALGTKAWSATVSPDARPWLHLSATGGLLPGEVRVRPSVVDLPIRSEPYRGQILVHVPGATTTPRHVDVAFTVVPPSWPLLTVTSTGSGIVTGPGITCPADCTEPYDVGHVVTLTATPAPGHALREWQGACAGQRQPCSVRLDRATTVGAVFGPVPPPVSLTVTVTGEGTVVGPGIACPGDCTERYPMGTAVTLTATPATGWMVEAWTGACTGHAPACVLTLDTAQAVTAAFGPFTGPGDGSDEIGALLPSILYLLFNP